MSASTSGGEFERDPTPSANTRRPIRRSCGTPPGIRIEAQTRGRVVSERQPVGAAVGVVVVVESARLMRLWTSAALNARTVRCLHFAEP